MEYRKGQILILGAELETHEEKGGSSHSLCFFPTLKSIKDFAKAMENHIKNIYNCSYMCRLTARQLIDIVDFYGGTFIPAHVFTPIKVFMAIAATVFLKYLTRNPLIRFLQWNWA